MKQFARAVALITAFAITTRAIGFFFRIFLSRVIGPEMLGIYQIAMSFFMVFLTLVASGLPLVISKEIASRQPVQPQNHLPQGKPYRRRFSSVRSNIVLAGLFLSLAVSCLICVIVLVFQNLFSTLFTDERCIAILIALIPSLIASSVYTVLRAVWWGQKKFFKLGLTELVEQVIRVVLFVIFLAFAFAFTDLAQVAALSYSAAAVISAVMVVIIFLKTRKLPAQVQKNGLTANTSTENKDGASDSSGDKGKNTALNFPVKLLKSAAPITGVRAATTLSMSIIAIIIPIRLVAAGWTNTAAISQFGIAIGMTLPLITVPQTVISSLATALVPELSSAIGRKNNAEVQHQITSSLSFTLFIVFMLLPCYIALGPFIGEFLYANSLSGTYLAKAAWIMIPLSLSQITNTILNSMGAETKTFKHYLAGSVVLFGAVWFLPKYIGIEALIVGLGACTSVASLLNLNLIGKLTKQKTSDVASKIPNVKPRGIRQIFTSADTADRSTLGITLSSIAGYALVSIPAILAGNFTYGIIGHVFPVIISLALGGIVTVAVFLCLAHMFKLVNLSQFRLNEKAAKHK